MPVNLRYSTALLYFLSGVRPKDGRNPSYRPQQQIKQTSDAMQCALYRTTTCFHIYHMDYCPFYSWKEFFQYFTIGVRPTWDKATAPTLLSKSYLMQRCQKCLCNWYWLSWLFDAFRRFTCNFKLCAIKKVWNTKNTTLSKKEIYVASIARTIKIRYIFFWSIYLGEQVSRHLLRE